MRKLELTQAEHDDLLEFLRTLTADKTETTLPNLPN
jgi:cytochrome c peroxidase